MSISAVICVYADRQVRSEVVQALSDQLSVVDVVGVETPDEALDAVDPDRTAAVVTDAFADAETTGAELLARVRERAPDATRLLYAETDPLTDGETGDHPYVFAEMDTTDHAAIVGVLTDATASQSGDGVPMPFDEEERRAEIERYPVSYEPLQAALDRIVELASGYFGTTFTNVHLITADEQRSLACRGPAPLDALREDSVCTYTILTRDVTVVEDLRADPRFADKSYVDDYGVRGYAGAPIVTPDGARVGTVCILDEEPIDLSEDEKRALEGFAQEAADQFVLNRARYYSEVQGSMPVERTLSPSDQS